MQGVSDSKPLIVHVLEALAFAAAWNKGIWTVTLEFDDGHLRRWSVSDPRNSPHELRVLDESFLQELRRLGVV